MDRRPRRRAPGGGGERGLGRATARPGPAGPASAKPVPAEVVLMSGGGGGGGEAAHGVGAASRASRLAGEGVPVGRGAGSPTAASEPMPDAGAAPACPRRQLETPWSATTPVEAPPASVGPETGGSGLPSGELVLMAAERPSRSISAPPECPSRRHDIGAGPRGAMELVKGREGWLLSGGGWGSRRGVQGRVWPASPRPIQGGPSPPPGPGSWGGRGGSSSSGPIRPSCSMNAWMALSGTWTRPRAPKRSVSSRRYSKPLRQRSHPTRWASTSALRPASSSLSR